jgi:NAD(P)H dehydrogenase (quinone)
MPKVLVLYYSSYGHMETMAHAVADGARSAGAEVDVRRVAETAPLEVAQAAGFKLDQAAPVIGSAEELANYDAIIVGAPTRYGRLSSQMGAFWDTAGGVWARGALHGKVGSVFTSTASQHGGQETTLLAGITQLLHFGMVIVGLPYSFQGQMRLDEITGGSPLRHHDHRRRPRRAPAVGERAGRRPLPGAGSWRRLRPSWRPDRPCHPGQRAALIRDLPGQR